jgi:hypothetical protein
MTNLSIYILLKARYGRKLRDLLEFPKKKSKTSGRRFCGVSLLTKI